MSPARGARIEVNDELVELNTLLALAPGRYRVVAKAPGHQPQEKIVEVVAGKQTPVTIALKPLGEAPTAEAQQPPPAADPGTPTPPPSGGETPKPPDTQVAANTPPAGTGTTNTDTQPAAGTEPQTTKPETPPAPKKVAAIFEGEDGAEISLEGRSVGRTPDARAADLEVGKKYKFRAKLAGYKPYSGEFTPDGREPEMKVAFELTKEPERETPVREPKQPRPPPTQVVTKPKATKAMGKLACSTKPAGADILVDGKKTGRQTPVPLSAPLELPVGARKISFRLNGKTTKPMVVNIPETGVAKLPNVLIE